MATFSTKDECLIEVEAVRRLIERLPVASLDKLGMAFNGLDSLIGGITQVETVEPHLAHGTHHYRAARGMEPIDG
jgi:hypothetical protein